MEAKPQDRRVRRTRKLLKEGLTELLKEKPFSEISAKEITDRKDLNRATFYLHYKSTYELLQDVEDDFFRQAQEMFDERMQGFTGGSIRPVFEGFLDYIVDNQSLCDALISNDASSDFINRAYSFIHDNGESILRGMYPGTSEDRMEYLLGFTCYGLIGMVKNWFDHDMNMDKEDLLDLADVLVENNTRVLQ